METKYLEIDENEAPADLKLPLRYGNYRRVTAELAKRKRFKTSFEVWKHDRRAPLGGQHNDLKLPLRYGNPVWTHVQRVLVTDLKLPLRYGN